MAQTIFTITIFVSAFILFLVQPLIGKLILPKLGGTPQVWNTCMMFFQTALLAGYAYTHTVSTRLKLRQQLVFHGAMLGIPIVLMLLLPMYMTVKDWIPPTEGNPIPTTLLLLATVVGVPFFVVSTSAPLLQRWFAYSGHPSARDPYFLYSASNAGSLLSLLMYPAGIEPTTALQMQTWIWFGSYGLLAVFILASAYLIFKVAPSDESIAAEAAKEQAAMDARLAEAAAAAAKAAEEAAAAPVEPTTAVKAGPAPAMARGIQRKKGAKVPGAPDSGHPTREHAPAIESGATAPVTGWRRLRWILLGAVPSSLMLGVTSYISTDLSPFPLVWVIPLALYLLSFILVFMKTWTGKRFQVFSPQGYTLHQMTLFVGQPLGLVVLCFIILRGGFDVTGTTSLLMFGFFMVALACHGELAEDRPSTKYLTEFFLLMSVGGAVGGTFNGIFAPIVFQAGVWEFYVAIVVAGLIRPQYVLSGWFDELIMQAFPQFRSWVIGQGDEMAKSMGRQAPRTTYLFSYFLDIVFFLFILSLAYWLRVKYHESRFQENWLVTLMKFLNVPSRTQFGQRTTSYSFFLHALTIGPTLIFAFFFAGRPLRFGLAIVAIIYGSLGLADSEDNVLEARRTYFGLLRVMRGEERPNDDTELRNFTKTLSLPLTEFGEIGPRYRFTYLMHGTTYHGRNYIYNEDKDKDIVLLGEIIGAKKLEELGKNPNEELRMKDGKKPYRPSEYFRDLSRLATTYYHRYGPVGIVMEKDNWFKGPQNSYTSDVRLPVSMIGQIAASICDGGGGVSVPTLVETWSEPPFATIGLGTGTMASYARPYQHMTYYEIDEVIRHFSIPEEGGKAHFTFLEGAIRRGVNLEVVMGDARISLEPERKDKNDSTRIAYAGETANYKNRSSFVYQGDFSKLTGKDERCYSKAHYRNVNVNFPGRDSKDWADREAWLSQEKNMSASRERFYKVINVDAFSSDAIPVHLVTKEAIAIYMSKLRDDGVLCVHTSNRHMDLVRPVARIAMELSKEAKADAEKKVETFSTVDLRHFARSLPIDVLEKTGLTDYSLLNEAETAKKKEKGLKDVHDLSEIEKNAEQLRNAYIRGNEINCLVGKDGADKEKFMGHFSSEYVMIYRGEAFKKWTDDLGEEREKLKKDAVPEPRKSILNSVVHWYNPYTDHTEWRGGRHHKAPITLKDSLWTDDYSYILGILR